MSDDLRNDESKNKNLYPNLKINGRIFPVWLLKNYSKFKLPEIIRKDNEDPCNITTKVELRKFQEFIGSYLDYRSPYHDILLYYGLGAGKSASVMAIYNSLYNSTSGWNVFLLIKAALHDNPWEAEIKKWLQKDDYEHRYSNIVWIHYDSPYADKEFLDEVKKTDSSKKNLYIIDEVHNFIRNVYSNVTSKQGKRAITIYDYIIQDKKENSSTRVVLLSATPSINKPFEIGLLFNLLRPNIFPKSEILFEQYFVDKSSIPTINPKTKNMFQRRIMGLVSYYIGATPDLYASKSVNFVDVPMSEYQTDIYNIFEEIEKKISSKKKKASSSNKETYNTYTRQASNFVFPTIENISGDKRPRPYQYKIGEKEYELLLKTKNIDKIKKTMSSQSQAYFKALETFRETFDNYLNKIYVNEKDLKTNILNDIENFKKYDNYDNWYNKEKNKSELINKMMICSNKFVNIIFNVFKSKGPVLIYSNFVLIEGIDILKIYLKYFGFNSFNNPNAKDYFKYAEFHNNISKEVRKQSIKVETDPDNKYGKNIKIMLFSPAGAEGISLSNIRQMHITEPYFNEVRIIQMLGRGIRQCSHKDLPMEERHVEIYRYRSIKHNIETKETIEGSIVTKEKIVIEDKSKLNTIDTKIENLARSKQNLIESFLDTVKEAAIDCELNKNHNMMGSKYRCFKFNEISLFDKNIGPAYKEDIMEDMKFDNGSNSTKSITIRVKAIKIRGVIKIGNKEDISNYWYCPETGTIYDFDLNYPVGKVKKDINGIIEKIDKDTYVIDIIPVPVII
jgi:superfamily II DNA or RNA helicase